MKNINTISRILIQTLILSLFAGCGSLATINAPDVSLNLMSKAIELNIGDTTTVDYVVEPNDTAIHFESDNNEIVMIDDAGKLVGLTAGSANITVKAGSEVQTIPVKVKEVGELTINEVPIEISIGKTDISLIVGETAQLIVTVTGSDISSISYKSDNEDIATVDENGMVTALSAGTAYINITVGDVMQFAKITVAENETIFAINSEILEHMSSSIAAVSPSSQSSAPATNPTPSSSTQSKAPSSVAPTTGGGDVCQLIKENGKYYVVMCKGNGNGKKFGPLNTGMSCHACGFKVNADGTIVNAGGKSASSPSADNSATSASKVDTIAYADEVLHLINEERTLAGLDELVEDSYLSEVARERSKEIMDNFSHTRPDGTTVADLKLGENISFGRKTPQIAVDAWMNSDGHKANILNDKYISFGACCIQGETGQLFWVVTFRKS